MKGGFSQNFSSDFRAGAEMKLIDLFGGSATNVFSKWSRNSFNWCFYLFIILLNVPITVINCGSQQTQAERSINKAIHWQSNKASLILLWCKLTFCTLSLALSLSQSRSLFTLLLHRSLPSWDPNRHSIIVPSSSKKQRAERARGINTKSFDWSERDTSVRRKAKLPPTTENKRTAAERGERVCVLKPNLHSPSLVRLRSSPPHQATTSQHRSSSRLWKVSKQPYGRGLLWWCCARETESWWHC